MTKRPRSPHAARRASFGRAERLRRDAGDTKQPRTDAHRNQRDTARTERAAKQDGQPRPARTTRHERKPTPLHRVEERLARSREASDRQYTSRLKEQTRGGFNRAAERRRDTTQRAEHDRKHDALQAKARRIEDHLRRANARRLERKRGEMRREYNRVADRRRDAIRRAHEDHQKAQAAERQKEMQRRAAIEIDREQKRRSQDQQAAHRRQTDGMRTRHGIARNGFDHARAETDKRLHHALTNSHEREARELAEFDGRRKGLAGRVIELVGRTGSRNDREREAIVQRHETERRIVNVDHAALRERQDQREQQGRIDRMKEQKALFELIRDERATFGRQQADDRPRLIEDRARVMDRADRTREQAMEREHVRAEQPRENVRPTGEFRSAASGHVHEPTIQHRALNRDEGRELNRTI